MKPSRDDPGGCAYLDLQNLARNNGRPVHELLTLFVLEAFLERLASSPHRSEFVLKGGVLLAAFGERRPTRDVDLHTQTLSNDVEVVRARVVTIASEPIADGVVFDTAAATAAPIRDEDAYTGVRVSMRTELSTARLPFHVDVSIGDPITPAPADVEVPRLLGGSITILGYPLEMVYAEKIVTAIARGTVNTRWRDFLDVVSLARSHSIGGDALVGSIRDVAEHRAVQYTELVTVLEGYGTIGQAKWAAWRRRQQVEDRSPESFEQLIEAFIAFANPACSGDALGKEWNPQQQIWT